MNKQPDLQIIRIQESNEMVFYRIYKCYHKALHGVIFNVAEKEVIAE
jgi:hypothetical protein